MKKILFFILVVSLSGCSISKKTAVKENVKLDTVENVDRSEKENTTQSSYTDAVKEVKTNVTDKTITRTTETEYSEPDESGTQYKTRERTTETLNDIVILDEEKVRLISEYLSEIERLTTENSQYLTKLEESLQEETKITTRVPIVGYMVLLAIGAALALILRSWLKGIFKR